MERVVTYYITPEELNKAVADYFEKKLNRTVIMADITIFGNHTTGKAAQYTAKDEVL